METEKHESNFFSGEVNLQQEKTNLNLSILPVHDFLSHTWLLWDLEAALQVRPWLRL